MALAHFPRWIAERLLPVFVGASNLDVYADRVHSHVLAFVDFALPCRDLHFASFCPFLRQIR